jgi:hypothetical protein
VGLRDLMRGMMTDTEAARVEEVEPVKPKPPELKK